MEQSSESPNSSMVRVERDPDGALSPEECVREGTRRQLVRNIGLLVLPTVMLSLVAGLGMSARAPMPAPASVVAPEVVAAPVAVPAPVEPKPVEPAVDAASPPGVSKRVKANERRVERRRVKTAARGQ